MNRFDYSKDFFGFFTPDKGGFYVYLLIRPNGQPFYVGKGTANRIDAHEKEARKGHECHKCRVIRKIWKNGGQVEKQIIFRTNNQDEAYRIEAITIARFRNRIVNHLDRQIGYHGKLGVATPKPRMTKAQREAALNRRIEKLNGILSSMEKRSRYLRLQGTKEERREIEKRIETLNEIIEWLVWPPKQSSFLDED